MAGLAPASAYSAPPGNQPAYSFQYKTRLLAPSPATLCLADGVVTSVRDLQPPDPNQKVRFDPAAATSRTSPHGPLPLASLQRQRSPPGEALLQGPLRPSFPAPSHPAEGDQRRQEPDGAEEGFLSLPETRPPRNNRHSESQLWFLIDCAYISRRFLLWVYVSSERAARPKTLAPLPLINVSHELHAYDVWVNCIASPGRNPGFSICLRKLFIQLLDCTVHAEQESQCYQDYPQYR